MPSLSWCHTQYPLCFLSLLLLFSVLYVLVPVSAWLPSAVLTGLKVVVLHPIRSIKIFADTISFLAYKAIYTVQSILVVGVWKTIGAIKRSIVRSISSPARPYTPQPPAATDFSPYVPLHIQLEAPNYVPVEKKLFKLPSGNPLKQCFIYAWCRTFGCILPYLADETEDLYKPPTIFFPQPASVFKNATRTYLILALPETQGHTGLIALPENSGTSPLLRGLTIVVIELAMLVVPLLMLRGLPGTFSGMARCLKAAWNLPEYYRPKDKSLSDEPKDNGTILKRKTGRTSLTIFISKILNCSASFNDEQGTANDVTSCNRTAQALIYRIKNITSQANAPAPSADTMKDVEMAQSGAKSVCDEKRAMPYTASNIAADSAAVPSSRDHDSESILTIQPSEQKPQDNAIAESPSRTSDNDMASTQSNETSALESPFSAKSVDSAHDSSQALVSSEFIDAISKDFMALAVPLHISEAGSIVSKSSDVILPAETTNANAASGPPTATIGQASLSLSDGTAPRSPELASPSQEQAESEALTSSRSTSISESNTAPDLASNILDTPLLESDMKPGLEFNVFESSSDSQSGMAEPATTDLSETSSKHTPTVVFGIMSADSSALSFGIKESDVHGESVSEVSLTSSDPTTLLELAESSINTSAFPVPLEPQLELEIIPSDSPAPAEELTNKLGPDFSISDSSAAISETPALADPEEAELSDSSRRVYTTTTNKKTIKRKALAYRARFRQLPFAMDKKDDEESGEDNAACSSILLYQQPQEPAQSLPVIGPIESQTSTRISSHDRQNQSSTSTPAVCHQYTPEEFAAYVEEAKELALKYFWQEKFVFDPRYVATIRPKLDQREKKILNSLQRVKEGRHWKDEDRSALRSSVYAEYVDGLGYVVTSDAELRRDSLEPKKKEGEADQGMKERIGRGSKRSRGKKHPKSQDPMAS